MPSLLTLKSFDAVYHSALHLNTGDALPHSHIVIYFKTLSAVMRKMNCFIFHHSVTLFLKLDSELCIYTGLVMH